MPSASPTLIRPSTDRDVASICEIYCHHVVHGTGTFELTPPAADEIARRRAEVVAKGWPWLVAEVKGQVLGYAYANHFRPRPAYRFCLEDSIYVAHDAARRGLGRLLLAELLACCEALGARQMPAVIGDSANLSSIALHRDLGFEPTGTILAAGWKFDRWLDVVVMQKALGQGSRAAADRAIA